VIEHLECGRFLNRTEAKVGLKELYKSAVELDHPTILPPSPNITSTPTGNMSLPADNAMQDEKLNITHDEVEGRQIDLTAAEIADAQRAAMAESHMGFAEAFGKYKKGLFWSMAVSCVRIEYGFKAHSKAIIMESYDTMLVTTFFSYPTFVKKFGDQLPNGTFSIPAQWQTALGLAPTVGIIIGIFANGFLLDRFGRKSSGKAGLNTQTKRSCCLPWSSSLALSL
jgi:hypothetical protein